MTEHLCEVCASGTMRRSERRGFFERHIFPLFGFYPWRCIRCRARIQMKDRGNARQYVRSDRGTASHKPAIDGGQI